jgi:hypothetical protein
MYNPNFIFFVFNLNKTKQNKMTECDLLSILLYWFVNKNKNSFWKQASLLRKNKTSIIDYYNNHFLFFSEIFLLKTIKNLSYCVSLIYLFVK